MILIYVERITPRLKYTVKTVYKCYLGIDEYRLTTNVKEFEQHTGNKFSYASQKIKDELNVTPSGLLFENGIKEQIVSMGEWENTITLFANAVNKEVPFDIFSAVFYCLTRYEEYLPHVRDKYDRFVAKDSLAFQQGFLHIAVVDRWMLLFKDLMLQRFSAIESGTRKFNYIPSIDIDNAYAFKYKGILRTIGSLGKSIFNFNFKELQFKLAVLTGSKKDPFDTYNYQLNIQKKYKIKPIYFVLIGDYGLNDKNLSYQNPKFKQLVKSLSDYAYLGIHPSYGSNKNAKKLKVEIKRLESIIKREVKKSRQHFLKLSLPETYRNLLEADIEEDYTMGFASQLGFRAGTCTPYPFYDLDEEVECKLIVYPFQVMESTLKYYLNFSAEKAIANIKLIIDEIHAVEGTFISLWHNESLSNQNEWEGWQAVYEQMIEYTMELMRKQA